MINFYSTIFYIMSVSISSKTLNSEMNSTVSMDTKNESNFNLMMLQGLEGALSFKNGFDLNNKYSDLNMSDGSMFKELEKYGNDIWDINKEPSITNTNKQNKQNKTSENEQNKMKYTKAYDEPCDMCNGTSFYVDMHTGQKICDCGNVLESDIISNEVERINYDGNNGPSRCGVTHNPLLPQSSLGYNAPINRKLDRIQKSIAMPYKERSNWGLMKIITNVCRRNNISNTIKADAHALVVKVSNTRHTKGQNKGKFIITRGSNRYSFVAACLFLMCRKNKQTRSIREIADYFNIEEGDVNDGVKLIMSFLKDDNIIIDTGKSNVFDFIQRKCDELRLKNVHTKLALTMARNIDKLGIASKHQTYSLAAGCVKLRLEIGNIEYITKDRLSSVFTGLTETTITKTYKELLKYAKVIVSNEITDNIMKIIREKREKRKITHEIKTRMDKYGIDTSKYIIEDNVNITSTKKGKTRGKGKK